MRNFLASHPLVMRATARFGQTTIAQRIRYLIALNGVVVIALISLGAVHSQLKNQLFAQLERMHTERNQLLQLNAGARHLQASIREHLNSPSEVLLEDIEETTARLFTDYDSLQRNARAEDRSFAELGPALRGFVDGFRELKDINSRVDRLYHEELQEPASRASELLALLNGTTSPTRTQYPLIASLQNANSLFIEAVLKLNTYQVRRDTVVSLTARDSLDRVLTMTPAMRSMAPSPLQLRALDQLDEQLNTLVRGIGSLQRAFASQQSTLDKRIGGSQRTINQIVTGALARNAASEEKLRSEYMSKMLIVSVLVALAAALVLYATIWLGMRIARSVRAPLDALLRTVEAYSAGDFRHPVPDVGSNELGQLAGALRDLQRNVSARQRAELALRESEARLRSLSDMASDFFWEQDVNLRYSAFTGQRAGQLLSSKSLSLGLTPWENPHKVGDETHWSELRQRQENRQPFRDFEFALQLPDDSVCHISANGDPVYDAQGNFAGYRGTAKDITGQRAAAEEIRQLNMTLEARVRERTRELERANEQLSQAMQQLVQSEKLASLGSLVAGVAHELNTPLGNALTASTALREHLSRFNELMASQQLRRSDLTEFHMVLDEGCELIERNARRAADLIGDFKQVAVDQTSAQRRVFDLRQTVEEVIVTLQPMLRRTQHEIVIDIPDGITLDSYPGPIGQVVTNIVSNAVTHAFPDAQVGAISLSAHRIGDNEIGLVISDNGTGIPIELQSRVFDPFFTTRLGQGGSGLGLHIAYNLITSVLGGHIQLLSAPGRGTCFVLRIPRALGTPLAAIVPTAINDTVAGSRRLH